MSLPHPAANESQIPTERSEGAGNEVAVAAKRTSHESRPLRVAVLASGRGSNLQALINARDGGTLPIELVGLFCDRPTAPAIERARAANVPAVALRPKDYATREAFDAALFDAVAEAKPELIVCAGFMRIIADEQVARFAGRMINIHPSLLPNYTGLHTHARALAAGDAEHGASVHIVIPALDAGPVLAQALVPVLAGDTAETLAERVLAREHPLLLATVGLFAAGRVCSDGEQVELDGRPLRQPLQLDETDQLLICDQDSALPQPWDG